MVPRDQQEKYVPQGRIEVIAGGMFSGKSEELIRRVRREIIAGRSVRVYKPKVDDRYATNAVVSHIKNEIPCTTVADTEELCEDLRLNTAPVIAIDEAQFFGFDLAKIANRLANQGRRVIIAGLDMDSEGLPFGPIPVLMAMAEDVEKLHAVCIQCGEDASFSFHKGKKAGQVEVGADQYEARCRACWSEGNE
jgi:thymidine kinase